MKNFKSLILILVITIIMPVTGNYAQKFNSTNSTVNKKELLTQPVIKTMKVDISKDTVMHKKDAQTIYIQDTLIDEQTKIINKKTELVDSLNTEIKLIQTSVIDNIKNGALTFIGIVNWLYIFIFIIIAWLINDNIDATNKSEYLNWLMEVPKFLRSLIIGIIIALLFFYFFRYNSREQVFGLFCSLLLALIIYKLGIKQVLAWISKYVFKFDI